MDRWDSSFLLSDMNLLWIDLTQPPQKHQWSGRDGLITIIPTSIGESYDRKQVGTGHHSWGNIVCSVVGCSVWSSDHRGRVSEYWAGVVTQKVSTDIVKGEVSEAVQLGPATTPASAVIKTPSARSRDDARMLLSCKGSWKHWPTVRKIWIFILYTKYFLFSSEVNWNQWECCVAGLLASPRTRLPADFIQLQIKRSTLLPLLFPKLRFPWYSSLCPSFVHQSHEYQRVHYISLDPMSEMENRQGGFLPRPENAVAS